MAIQETLIGVLENSISAGTDDLLNFINTMLYPLVNSLCYKGILMSKKNPTKSTIPLPNINTIHADLDHLFALALEDRNLSVALKIKEFQAKELDPKPKGKFAPAKSLQDLSDHDLAAFILDLESP
ncbi:MAG: hypothetical protein NTX76_04485 [Alphaproteobacteria bacterium]|nr:hypothetical protein [Alphaproteobacteria bacterium]